MERNNVATAILSGVTFPEPLNDGTEQARTLARRANEFAASVARDHPERFGFLAAVPLADTEGSLREIEYAFDTLDKLRRLYLEVGHASFPWVVTAALEFAGPTQLLFGTDFPVEPYETTTRHIPALDLPPDVLYAMDRGNAERIFPRYRS